MGFINFNLVDLCLIVVVLFFIRDGYRKGFFALTLEIFCFALGIVLAMLTYAPLSDYLVQVTTISRPYTKVLSFFSIWLLIEAVIPPLTAYFYHQLPVSWLHSKVNLLLGIVPACIEAVLLSAFVLSLALSFPLPPRLKQEILTSHVGQPMTWVATDAELFVSQLAGISKDETLSFLTVDQTSKESVKLGFTSDDFFPDTAAERQLFDLINIDRQKIGLQPLVRDQSLVDVARRHAADMLKKGYFAHVSPDGRNVADRANRAAVVYRLIGENLAYAPDVVIAHLGLMKSDSHRSNILSSQFSRIGIGVQNAGTQGMMVVEVFAD